MAELQSIFMQKKENADRERYLKMILIKLTAGFGIMNNSVNIGGHEDDLFWGVFQPASL